MLKRFSGSMINAAIVGAAVVGPAGVATAPAQTGTVSVSEPAALRTAWGAADLQGIWTDETDTPLQRSPKYANQEFFTEAQRAELDRERAAMPGRDKRAERGTVADVAGAYNDTFTPKKRTGLRTSRIVDPPNGRLPPLTPRLRRRQPPTAHFDWRCCKRPRPARIKSRHAAAAHTIPRRRRDLPILRRATTRRRSIAMTDRRMPRCRCAA